MAAAFALGLAVGARADEGEPGRPRVLVRSTLARGWDAFMPRGGAYQRALDAALAGRWRLAGEQFLEAGAEVRRLARDGICGPPRPCRGRPTRALLRNLLRKTTFEADQANALSVLAFAASTDKSPASPEQRLRETAALHNLYLAARAFHGRDLPDFRHRVEAVYRAAIAPPEKGGVLVGPGPTRTRLQVGLAALLATSPVDGDRAQARLLFEEIPAADLGPEVLDVVALYHASIGDADAAFSALATLRSTLPEWDEQAALFRVANDLDPLRDDPRFTRILGDNE